MLRKKRQSVWFISTGFVGAGVGTWQIPRPEGTTGAVSLDGLFSKNQSGDREGTLEAGPWLSGLSWPMAAMLGVLIR